MRRSICNNSPNKVNAFRITSHFSTVSTQRPKQHDSSKRRLIFISLHSTLSQKTSICTKNVRTSRLKAFLYNNLTSLWRNITCRNTPVVCTGVQNSPNVDWDPHNIYIIYMGKVNVLMCVNFIIPSCLDWRNSWFNKHTIHPSTVYLKILMGRDHQSRLLPVHVDCFPPKHGFD